jgi:hypothetical protein
MMTEGYADATEYVNWKDEGCDLYPACLECSLARCVEDEPRGRQKRTFEARNEVMRQMRRQGMSVREIAAVFALGVRAVQRIVQKKKIPNTKIQIPNKGRKGKRRKLKTLNSKR